MRPVLKRPPLIATIMLALGVLVLCSLGNWQIQRLAWKQDLLAALDAEYQKNAAHIMLSAKDAALTRGSVKGRYLHDKEFLLGPRTHEGMPGYHVITPLQTLQNEYLLINRGWVPLDTAYEKPQGPQHITGLLRPAPAPNFFTPENNSAQDQWYRIEIRDIEKRHNIPALWPLILYAEPTHNADGVHASYPLAQATKPHLKNDHAQYAAFWFAMAGILVIIFILRFVVTGRSNR